MRALQTRRRLAVAACLGMMVGGLGAPAAHAANGSVAYTYDALGRITTVSYDTGVCIAYTYDANGNRTTQQVRVAGAGSPTIWGCFIWNQANWLQ